MNLILLFACIGEIVYAHKIVLSSLGQSFLNMFTLGMKESLG